MLYVFSQTFASTPIPPCHASRAQLYYLSPSRHASVERASSKHEPTVERPWSDRGATLEHVPVAFRAWSTWQVSFDERSMSGSPESTILSPPVGARVERLGRARGADVHRALSAARERCAGARSSIRWRDVAVRRPAAPGGRRRHEGQSQGVGGRRVHVGGPRVRGD